jgi:hypothetical protein
LRESFSYACFGEGWSLGQRVGRSEIGPSKSYLKKTGNNHYQGGASTMRRSFFEKNDVNSFFCGIINSIRLVFHACLLPSLRANYDRHSGFPGFQPDTFARLRAWFTLWVTNVLE